MSKEDIKLIWQTINCEACYNENINYCKEKCECKCKEFKALENIFSYLEELGEINFRLLNNGVPKEVFDELRLKLKKEKNENEANKKRIEELEEENKKKDNIIDLMADKIASDNRSINEEYAVDEKMMDTKYIKQYFEKKGDGDEFYM